MTNSYVSSGGYAHRVGKSMALGYVNTACAVPGTQLEVKIWGVLYPARVLDGPAYDANGGNMRS